MGQSSNTSLALLGLGAGVMLLLGPINPYRGAFISAPAVEEAAVSRTGAAKDDSVRPEERGLMSTESRSESDIVAAGARDELVEAQMTDLLFDGFLKFKRYELELKTPSGPSVVRGGFVHGPGHNSAAIAALVFDVKLKPYLILKTGDTRLSRAERGEPYVMDGFVAGRMDKQGAESSKIALGELAEEVGGEVVNGTFTTLSENLSPTMPLESTEADAYFLAAVTLSGKPAGDGGEMELAELIGPKIVPVAEGIRLMDEGLVSDASRARTLHGRALDKVGYVSGLGVWVQDYPQLLARYDTLGVGEVFDLRDPALVSAQETLTSKEPKSGSLKSRVNHVISTQREDLVVSDHSKMVDSKTKHAVKDGEEVTPLEPAFANQYLALDYDRAKIAHYFVHPEKGPMVQMKRQLRPPLALATDLAVFRRDVEDIRRPRDETTDVSGARKLGAPCGASAGQTDLYYQFWAKEVAESQDDFVTLAQAIQMCRFTHGDSQTEALLLRLADDLNWLPNLGMGVEQARAVLQSS